MRSHHFRFMGLLLICLLITSLGCLTTEGLPTQVNPTTPFISASPEQAIDNTPDLELTTIAQESTNTAPAQPTATLPASSLSPQVQALCTTAFASAPPTSNSANLTAPFMSSISRDYNDTGWVYEQTLAYMEAKDASQVATLVCIQESRVNRGEYQNGAPAYRLDWEIRLLQWPDGTQLAIWTEPGSPVRGAILSGDTAGYGEPPRDTLLQYLASASDNRSLIFLEKAVSGLAFSPDGQTLYIAEMAPRVSSYTGGTEEMGIWVWNLADWRAGQHLGSPGHVGHPDEITAFSLSAGGHWVAAGRESGLVQVWDTSSLAQVAQFQAGEQGFYGLLAIAFSPDEALLAALAEDKVTVWQISTQELLWQKGVAINTQSIGGMAFQPNGQALAVGVHNETILFSSQDGTRLGQIDAVTYAEQLLFSSDGKILWYTTYPSGLYAENLVGGPDPQFERGLPLSDGFCSLIASRDGVYLAAGSCKGEVVIWRTDTGEVLTTLTGHQMPVWALAFSPDGKILASGSDDRSVRLWFAGSDYPPLP